MQIDAVKLHDAIANATGKQARHGIPPHPPTACAGIATPNCSSELCGIQYKVVEDYCAIYAIRLISIAVADEAAKRYAATS